MCYDRRMKPFTLFLILACLLPFTAPRAEGIKESTDYLMDDGVMTQDEMEDEAQYIYRDCQANPMTNLYYNCACVGGAFLIQREKRGPMYPQGWIYQDILKNPKLKCVNEEAYAGDNYKTCMSVMGVAFELGLDNKEICTCAANRAARNFNNNPEPGIAYTGGILGNAIQYCQKPENRPVKKKSTNTTDFSTLNR